MLGEGPEAAQKMTRLVNAQAKVGREHGVGGDFLLGKACGVMLSSFLCLFLVNVHLEFPFGSTGVEASLGCWHPSAQNL